MRANQGAIRNFLLKFRESKRVSAARARQERENQERLAAEVELILDDCAAELNLPAGHPLVWAACLAVLESRRPKETDAYPYDSEGRRIEGL